MAQIVIPICLAFVALILTVGANVDQGGCTCGVFPENSTSPIIEHPLSYNVSCDEEGAGICRHLCIALAEGAKDKAPGMICEKLNKHVENLKIAVFTKSCSGVKNDNEWKFTGLKSTEPICCHEGKETECGLSTNA